MNKIEEILTYEKFGMKLGLENIEFVLKKLNKPQNSYKIIHIAGTNGKGSVASIISTALIEAGYSVGKYSSPYLEKLNEMFDINASFCLDDEIYQEYLKIKKVMEEYKVELTLYEITTCIMFLLCVNRVDFLVLEVGLGGRYDATNICKPIISIITNISLDHTNILGNNILDIAKEKAGIIKKGIPLYTTCKDKDILAIFKKKTDDIFLIDVDKECELDYNKFTTNIDGFKLPLYGKHQVENFLLSKKVLNDLKIDDKIIKKSLKNIKHPARLEKINKNFIFDGAHNVSATKSLVKSLYEVKDITIVISILKDKDVKGIINELKKLSNNFIFIPSKVNKRELSIKDFLLYDFDINLQTFNTFEEFYNKRDKNKLYLVCGSLSLYKEVKTIK